MIVGVSMALGVWLLHQMGWLAAWDGVFYDRILAWTTGWRELKPKVLLVHLGHDEPWSDAEASRTLDTLENLGAKAVVFDSIPRRASREFFQRAAELKNVVLGRELHPDPDDPDRLRLDEWPAAVRGRDLPWGVVFLPPSIKGVYRWQQAAVRVGTNTYPTLESRASALCKPASPQPAGTGAFLVNFAGGPGNIPSVRLSRVLSGDLIAQMVRSKVVVVGARDGFLGLDTPVSSGAERMTFLEFQGNALQTLLDGTPIRPLSWPQVLFLLAGLGAISSLLYQRVNSLAGVRLAFGIFAGCALAAVAGLVFFRFWLPLGTLCLAQGGQFALTLVFKTRMSNLAFNEMRLHALGQLKERACPSDSFSVAEHWEHLASMIYQTLDVERMLFFERIPQTQELVPAKAFNCTFEDLEEKEGSLEAPVFAATLAHGRPARVVGFFKPRSAAEFEYVCPLVFSGKLFGMWAVAMDPAKGDAIPQLEVVLGRFSQQIACLLDHRKHFARKLPLAARLRRWFSTEKGDQAGQELSRATELLEQCHELLETLFNQAGPATIVYDLFGRVLKASDQALALLRAENFVPTRGTALELLRLLTRKEDSEVRRLLRNIFLERAPASLSVRLASQEERQFLLRLYPLMAQKQAQAEPFGVRGIVCELMDTTAVSSLAGLKALVADRLGTEIRDHLAAIEISAGLLESDELPRADRQSVLEVIHHKTRTCVQVINECRKYLGREVEAHAVHCFPLNPLEVLDRACSQFTQKAAERQVLLNREQPRLPAQVLASPAELERLFASALELLLSDAAESTALTIKVEDASNLLTFQFSNRGFGIPDERLQGILTSLETTTSKEFQVLRDATGWVRDWGGKLEVRSEVGEGYSITLRLRQFQLANLFPASPA